MMETEIDCFTTSARLTASELDCAFNMRAVFECCTFSSSFSEPMLTNTSLGLLVLPLNTVC